MSTAGKVYKCRLLDGGMGAYLSLSHPEITTDKLWSAKLLCDKKGLDAIKRAHLDFLRAGARCIKTCSYQATKERLVFNGVESPDKVIFRSVEVAREAISEFLEERKKQKKPCPKEIQIFRSCGPFHVLLADASEYRGTFPDHVTDDEILAMHRNQINIMARDLRPSEFLCFETIATAREARLLMKLLQSYRKAEEKLHRRVVMSFVVHEGAKLPDGTKYADIVQELQKWDSNHKFLYVIGANCSLPEDVYGAFEEVAANSPAKPGLLPKWGAWPNAGYRWLETENRYDDQHPSSIEHYASKLQQLGVLVIGGCCSVNPSLLAKVGGELRR